MLIRERAPDPAAKHHADEDTGCNPALHAVSVYTLDCIDRAAWEGVVPFFGQSGQDRTRQLMR